MSSGQQAPPGWYADPWPGPPGALRWWDGSQWTSATSSPGPPGRPEADAGWWRRAGAFCIDGFIVSAISWIVGLPAQLGLQRDLQVEQERLTEAIANGDAGPGMAAYWTGLFDAWADRWVWLGLLPALAALAYHVVMLRTRSRTVGKQALGLRVTSVGGDERLSWSTVVRRVLAQFGPGWLVLPVGAASGSLSTIALMGLAVLAWQLLDHLWAASPRRRALHDLAAGTRVVRVP